MDNLANAVAPPRKRRPVNANIKKTIALTSMVLPGAVWLFLIRYVPMFGLLIAFKEYKIANAQVVKKIGVFGDIIERDWIGLKNFEILFNNPMTGKIIRNTLLYNAVFIILGTIIAVAFAIMLNEISKKWVAKAYQTAMFFPYFLSWVVVSYFLMAFISEKHGLIDANSFGFSNFYMTSKPWPLIMVVAYIWKMTGYSSILYLAAITGIDATQYEAASIDGATKWQQIIHITLPNLRTIIIILFIMNIGRIFNADFGQFWSLPLEGGSGSVRNVTEVVDTYIYYLLKKSVNVGQSTAVGFFQNIVGFICVITANTIVRKVDRDSAMF